VWLGSIWSCTEIDSNPPEFEGAASVAAVSEHEVAALWRPASDDYNEGHELRYQIWVAAEGELIDLDTPPRAETREGALSYHLSGLLPDTGYQILVLATDRGDRRSEPGTALELQTPSIDSSPVTLSRTLDRNHDQAFATRIQSSRMVLGIVDGSEVDWFDPGSGTLNDGLRALQLERPPLEIHPAPIQSDRETEDLLVVEPAALLYYANRDGRFEDPVLISPPPAPDTLTTADLDDDDHLDLAYLTAAGEIVLQRGDGDGGFSLETAILGGQAGRGFCSLDLNGDDRLDAAVLSTQSLEIWLADRDGFDLMFEGEVTATDRDDYELVCGDFGGDSRPDLLVFRHDDEAPETKAFLYINLGDGDFEDERELDLGEASYLSPRFLAPHGLALVQESSNNAVVFRDLMGDLTLPEPLLGGVDQPDRFLSVDLDRDGVLDWVLASSESDRVVVAFRRSSMSM